VNVPADAVEIVRPGFAARRFQAVLFDFDGTLSLFREGWPAVMAGLMRDELLRTVPDEPAEQLERIIDGIVVDLNGRPTIVQMQALAAEIARRGGRPAEPAAYANEYQRLLLDLIRGRYDEVTSGRVSPESWSVAGSHEFLRTLRSRGLRLVLASGTEVTHVRREAEMLGLLPFFDETLFAPTGDDSHFSKRVVIEQILAEHRLRGEELLGFGDGVVETEEVRRLGGVAIGVASEELPRRGIHAGKRQRLIEAGADAIIADYQCRDALLRRLFAED
jgi:phosphoglycolate phosphatase-like HAD superfamily hydrolase